MVENFEHITPELTSQEVSLIPVLISGFKKHGQENPIKEPEILKLSNKYFQEKQIPYNLTAPKLRKFVSYMRSNGIIPIIATSKGYFVSNNEDVIESQIRSLQNRANGIMSAAVGLNRFIT